MQLDSWLTQARQRLQQAGSDSAKLDAELLAQRVLSKNRAWLFAFGETQLSEPQLQTLNEWLARRVDGEPMAYILGQRDFWSLTLATHTSTLIPRPDTETLVEWALELPLTQQASMLDLGTGTGAIALALASERPQWQVQAVDFQQESVQLAQQNAQQNHIHNTHIYWSDWFSEVQGQFDLIVSNPPYIDALDPHLLHGDVRYEPKTALVADHHGLADLQHIVQQAPNYLTANGWLLLEHGYHQASAVQQLLQQQGFTHIESRQDLARQYRVTGGCWVPHLFNQPPKVELA